MTTHTDLAPTIFDIIGIPPRREFDGIAIPLTQTALLEAKQDRYEHVNVEFWGLRLAKEITIVCSFMLYSTYIFL